jgi:hypothetical protein
MARHTVFGRLVIAALCALALLVCAAPAARGAVITGDGGQGVPVGQSGLIGQLDYSDTFTASEFGGHPDRVYNVVAEPAAYMVEQTYGNPPQQFTQQRGDTVTPPRPFQSFAAGSTHLAQGLHAGAIGFPGSSGAGSDTGYMQSGGAIDYGIPYGLRDEYVVQVDAAKPPDRVDIASGAVPGTIGSPSSVTVFFRGQAWATNATHANNISLYNGTTDTPLRGQPGFEALNTGLSDEQRNSWHNYAVRFDSVNDIIEMFIDEQSVALVDLTTFAGGIYAGFSNESVSVGGTAGDRIWTDNFQVGAPVPEPGTLAMLSLGLLAFARRPRRG